MPFHSDQSIQDSENVIFCFFATKIWANVEISEFISDGIFLSLFTIWPVTWHQVNLKHQCSKSETCCHLKLGVSLLSVKFLNVLGKICNKLYNFLWIFMALQKPGGTDWCSLAVCRETALITIGLMSIWEHYVKGCDHVSLIIDYSGPDLALRPWVWHMSHKC